MERMGIENRIDELKKILFESCSEDNYMNLMLELDIYKNEAQKKE